MRPIGAGPITSRAHPPGPPGHPLWGNTLALAADPLGFMLRCCEKFGDVVHLRVRGLDVYMVSGEREVHEVLVTDAGSYRMDRLSRGLSDALGESLLTGDGPEWRRRRAVLHRAFGRRQLAAQDATLTRLVDGELDGWLDFDVVDVTERMSRLAIDILLETVLGLPDRVATGRVVADVRFLMRHVLGIRSTGVRVPMRIPTPANRRARAAITRIGAELRGPGVGRPVRPAAPDGAATLLADYFETGHHEDPHAALTDELITLLLVGHETVAVALGYACWRLATHPVVQDELARQLLEASARGISKPAMVEEIPLLRAVIDEVLRLHPPVWAIGREAVTTTEVGGYRLRAGDQVVVPVWAIHHQERRYQRPSDFRPERWTADDPVTPGSFLPFGAGVRRCLGERFAYREMSAVLAAVVGAFRLEALTSPPVPAPSVTLRPNRPIVLIAERRTGGNG